MEALGYHSPSVAHAIGDAIQDVYNEGLTYKELKQNIAPLVEAIFTHISRSGIPITNKERLHKSIVKSFEIASKLAEKIINVNETNVEKLKTIRQIMGGKIEDPKSKLKEIGIDIEPELEEFRQFLAEISGKKIEPAKPKFPETKKAVEEEPKKTDAIKLEAQKLLGLLQGLKLANYSESVVENAKAELDKELDSLIENPENLELIGLYALILKLIEKKDFEKAERILKKL